MMAVQTLERTTFRTSRLLEFCSRKELIAQTGHEPDAWPLVVLKELVDNALDACEEAGIAYELVTTRAELEAALIDAMSPAPCRATRLLKGWRRTVAGDAVTALASGKVAVKAIPEPPFVSEIAV